MLLGVWAIAAALIGGAAAAHATPGALDRSFGNGGKVVTAANLGASWNHASIEAATAPNGDILVASRAQIARYLPDGRLDPSFGDGGLLNVELPEGLLLSLGALTVDSQGRAIVIGTATAPSPYGPWSEAYPSLAAFVRYRDDGSLDPSFGSDGVVLTNFGLQANSPYALPDATATLGAVDSAGRITAIAGTRDLSVPCGHPHFYRLDKAVVRLAPDGKLDPAFGDDGVHMLASPQVVTSLALGQAGETFFTGGRGGCVAPSDVILSRLAADGSTTLEAEAHERRPRRIAVDPQGRVILLGKTAEQRFRSRSVTRLVRLDPDGALDQSFGRNGVASVRLPGNLSRLNALATDPKGNLLLVGNRVQPMGPPHRYSARFRKWLAVVRLRASGTLDRSFSRRGLVVTSFGAHANVVGREALLDSAGRLVVAGSAMAPRRAPGGGFALARYIGGP